MRMKGHLFVLCMLLGAQMAAAGAKNITYNVQCWAEGNKFRVQDAPVTDYLTSSRLFLNIHADGQDSVVITQYLGHVSGAKFVEGAKELKAVDFYSQFVGEQGTAVVSSLSPRARKYPDAQYWRFKEFSKTTSTYQDGGDMDGTLVVSKNYNNDEVESFDAHYIFRHGDHTGGTIDFTCGRD